jgi:hypothetical protein
MNHILLLVVVFLFHFLDEVFQKLAYVPSKVIYRSLAGRDFFGTENEIWASFEPVGNTEKKCGGRL